MLSCIQLHQSDIWNASRNAFILRSGQKKRHPLYKMHERVQEFPNVRSNSRQRGSLLEKCFGNRQACNILKLPMHRLCVRSLRLPRHRVGVDFRVSSLARPRPAIILTAADTQAPIPKPYVLNVESTADNSNRLCAELSHNLRTYIRTLRSFKQTSRYCTVYRLYLLLPKCRYCKAWPQKKSRQDIIAGGKMASRA